MLSQIMSAGPCLVRIKFVTLSHVTNEIHLGCKKKEKLIPKMMYEGEINCAGPVQGKLEAKMQK